MPIRRHHIRRTVSVILETNQVTRPPVPVERIAKALGSVISIVPAEDDLSGFLLRRPGGGGAVIGVNAGHSETRQRFTIAHELGHLVLHATDELHVDRAGSVYRRNVKSSQGVDDREIEANLFAAELLMPVAFIKADLEKRDTLDVDEDKVVGELAAQYKVSTQAMTIRLTTLGLLTT